MRACGTQCSPRTTARPSPKGAARLTLRWGPTPARGRRTLPAWEGSAHLHHVGDLLQRAGVFDGGQVTRVALFAHGLDGAPQHLARTRLGQAADEVHPGRTRDRAEAFLAETEVRAASGLVGPNQVANARTFLAQQELLLFDRDELLGLRSDQLASLIGVRPESATPQYLPVDEPGTHAEDEPCDRALLRWISRPAEAPAAGSDGTAVIFRAVGEANEVREVLRRCVEGGTPFDDVEILHTDGATYLPLIYETACRLTEDDTGESIPATFAEGVPARYGRPARALLGWLSWVRGGYLQSVLTRMVQDGLLRIEEAERGGLSFADLGGLLRSVPIGSGRARYLSKIDGAIDAVQRSRASGARARVALIALLSAFPTCRPGIGSSSKPCPPG